MNCWNKPRTVRRNQELLDETKNHWKRNRSKMEETENQSYARPIKCFQHCENRDIFCFAVPSICPLCGKDTETTQSCLPPYIVPSPLTTADVSPMCVVVRPTDGTFTCDYTADCDLHIGLTSSTGVVYDFNETGLHIGSTQWKECVSIAMANQMSVSPQLWDTSLERYCQQTSNKPYSEKDFNCLDFVLGFLHYIDKAWLLPNLESRTAFSSFWIMPRFRKVVKYVMMYRDIEKYGFYTRP